MNIATLQMVQVDSSTINAWGYDSAQQVLKVRFNNGGLYQYASVPPDVWEGLKAADSAGSAFHQMIKKNPALYPYTKLS